MQARVTLNCQELALFIKTKNKQTNKKTTTLQQVTDGNTPVTARRFSKNSTTQENIRISRLKKILQNLYKKGNFKPKIKAMIENFQNELYHLENKQAKGAKLHAHIRWKLEGEKMLQNLLQST